MDSFADRLNALFDTHRREDGEPFSNVEIAQRTNNELEASYIGKLRKGERFTNPTRSTIIAIADAFGIEPDYFFRREPVVQEGMDQVRVALRSSGLNREAQGYLERLIDSLRKSKDVDEDIAEYC